MPDKFQETINTVKTKAGEVCVKLDTAKDVAKLTFRAKVKKLEIAKLYKKLGEKMYKNQVAADKEAEEIYEQIDEYKAQVEKIKKEISKIRCEKKCLICGKLSPRSFKFCPVCGNQL